MSEQDWDHWISHIDIIPELTPIEKERAKAALRYLKSFFKTDFDALTRMGHPVTWEIMNTSAWTRRYLTALANAIQEVRNQKNGSALVDKLRIANKYRGALFELDVSNCFISSGFAIEFYPLLAGTGKKPDMRITNEETDEDFYIELAELGTSESAQESNETFHAIGDKLFKSMRINNQEQLHCMGRIHKYLSGPSRTRILNAVDRVIEKAKHRGFATLEEKGIIELGIARTEKFDMLRSWAAERKIDATLIGPKYNTDEIRRIIKKIEKEQAQLPVESLNIIVIHPSLLLYSKGADHLISEIEEHLYDYEHVVFCILVTSFVGGGEQTEMNLKDDHIYATISDEDSTRDLIILTNKYVRKRISLNSLGKIRDAFMKSPIILH